MKDVTITNEQIEYIAKHIIISDVLAYIENNREDYESFIEEERKEEELETKRIKESKTMDKLELSNN